MHRLLMMICGGVLLLSLPGCRSEGSDAPDVVPVAGVITSQGKPLANWNLTFYPEGSGGPSYGKTDAEGKFQLTYNDGRPGAVPGPHNVLASEVVPEVTPEQVEAGVTSKTPAEKRLKVEVTAGKAEYQLEL